LHNLPRKASSFAGSAPPSVIDETNPAKPDLFVAPFARIKFSEGTPAPFVAFPQNRR
jgi:hypothetical protein